MESQPQNPEFFHPWQFFCTTPHYKRIWKEHGYVVAPTLFYYGILQRNYIPIIPL